MCLLFLDRFTIVVLSLSTTITVKILNFRDIILTQKSIIDDMKSVFKNESNLIGKRLSFDKSIINYMTQKSGQPQYFSEYLHQ